MKLELTGRDLSHGNYFMHRGNAWSFLNENPSQDKPDFLIKWDNDYHFAVGESRLNVEECLYPIQLTPKALEKCGLSRDSEGWFLSFDLKIYDPLVRNGVGGLSQNDFKIVSILYGTKLFPIGIKYLHQLQNLYFALTGEELTYTP